MGKLEEKKAFHKFTFSRAKYLRFWKGQIRCRLFGHRIPKDFTRPNCGRCGIALEEVYGLDFYDRYNI